MSWRFDFAALPTRLRRARAAVGLRQTDVADRVGVSVRHFARLEAAEIDPPARTLFAWADAVGLRVSLTDMSGEGDAQA